MKRDKVDALFSQYIRIRDKWICQVCNRSYTTSTQGLHCSHIFSRRHNAIRFDERNAVAMCFSCHQWYGGNPIEGGEWARRYLGPDVVDELIRIKNAPFKKTKAWESEVESELKAKLKELEG